ncbi:hypothetical protein AB0H36_27705 [Kribbella sp. NPDC050820]|uniref:hypothetical protein n=1 Tax=Kribbella sp. NPDC050820 TaxID=3155408 RepID=UPI0033E97332
MTTATAPVAPLRIVRVWFGPHIIAEYRAEAGLAGRYAAAMARRFPSLNVTNQPTNPPLAQAPDSAS